MRALGIAIALVACAAGTALADAALDAARKDVESSDYLAARTHLTAALGAGTASPEDLGEIYKLTGVVEGALGDDAAATAAFQKWLDLDPRGNLPDGTSPKIRRPFDAAAAAVRKRAPLRVKTETIADPPSVTLVIVSDPDQLIAKARVYVRADGGAEREISAANLKAVLPHGRRLDLRVQAVDRFGNRVADVGSIDVPIVITGAGGVEPATTTTATTTPPPTTTATTPPTTAQPPLSSSSSTSTESPEPAPRSFALRWWLYGSAAVVVGGAGAYFGFAGRSDRNSLDTILANSSSHTYPEAESLATRARHELLAFDIGMAAAGALAVTAGVLYLTEPRVAEHVSIAPAAGGAAVSLRGHF